MVIRLKRKIKYYINSIYLIDIIIVTIITLMLFSILGDYAQVNRVQHQLAVQEIKENTLKRPSRKTVEDFENILKSYGIEVTIRREMGTDINAACGQLRRSYLETQK